MKNLISCSHWYWKFLDTKHKKITKKELIRPITWHEQVNAGDYQITEANERDSYI